jgi:AmmeMemoRadiSam system protein B
MIKLPSVAGVFYPLNPAHLAQMLDQFLQEAASGEKPPKALIAPHAGYRYSGAVAASIYARLKNAQQPISRVILIGPAHRVAFDGLAVSRADAFNTPLGNIAVDKESIEKLLQLPFVQYLEQAHAHEHSLEVQLPFLQTLLSDFKIVPVLAGRATAEHVSQAMDLLWGGEETLIVVSSDLSHYHDYATATRLDQDTSKLIETLQFDQLTFESACGRIPLSGLLKLAKEKCMSIKTVDLRNSGDTSGDKTRVVGYGAYAIE